MVRQPTNLAEAKEIFREEKAKVTTSLSAIAGSRWLMAILATLVIAFGTHLAYAPARLPTVGGVSLAAIGLPSNVDFGFGLKTRHELDYYVGWYWPVTDEVNLDLGYIKYSYPKEGQFNQSEAYAILGAYGFTFAAQYSSDAKNLIGEKQDTLYSYDIQAR